MTCDRTPLVLAQGTRQAEASGLDGGPELGHSLGPRLRPSGGKEGQWLRHRDWPGVENPTRD